MVLCAKILPSLLARVAVEARGLLAQVPIPFVGEKSLLAFGGCYGRVPGTLGQGVYAFVGENSALAFDACFRWRCASTSGQSIWAMLFVGENCALAFGTCCGRSASTFRQGIYIHYLWPKTMPLLDAIRVGALAAKVSIHPGYPFCRRKFYSCLV